MVYVRWSEDDWLKGSNPSNPLELARVGPLGNW
jgi:hypothetical protein